MTTLFLVLRNFKTWNQPRKRRLEPIDVHEIKFVKQKYGKQKQVSNISHYDSRPVSFQKTTQEEVQVLHTKLSEKRKDIALLHILSVDNSSQSQDPLPSNQLLLPIPRSSRERMRYSLQANPQPVSLKALLECCQEFVGMLTPSTSEAETIERATRIQSDCRRWHEERYGRITSSKFGELVKCRQYQGHAQRMLHPTCSSMSTSTNPMGKENEETARQQYFETHLRQHSLTVRECGIFISHHGFLAASPDGIVCSKDGLPIGTLEIKCPYTSRSLSIAAACKKTTFCSEVVSSTTKISLKKTQNYYYYQVQGQLASLNLPWCDFVIWTLVDMHVERIHFDLEFWAQRCYPSLYSVYHGIILPELLYPRHHSGLEILDYRAYISCH